MELGASDNFATAAACEPEPEPRCTASDGSGIPYAQLVAHLGRISRALLPAGAAAAVVTRGDDELLRAVGPGACHFPGDAQGAYTGHYPADGAEAIDWLEQSYEHGTDYFVIPETARWWLEHYEGLRAYLHARHRPYWDVPGVGSIYRLGGPAKSVKNGRFFIVGCQRSGTTLMRLVLESHPRVECLDETRAYAALAGRAAPRGSAGGLVGFKIPRWTEQMANPRLSDPGLESDAEAFYSGEPLLFMLRDVRDTVASMVKLFSGPQGGWLEQWGIPILESKLKLDSFRERFAREVASYELAADRRVAAAALYWTYKTAPLFDYVQRGWPVLPVRYEDLARAPAPTLRRVLRWLGLPWEPAVLHHPRAEHGEILSDSLTVGATDPSRPIDAESVASWRRTLSPGQVDDVLAVAGDLNERIRDASGDGNGGATC